MNKSSVPAEWPQWRVEGCSLPSERPIHHREGGWIKGLVTCDSLRKKKTPQENCGVTAWEITWLCLWLSNWALRETSEEVKAHPAKWQTYMSCANPLHKCKLLLFPLQHTYSAAVIFYIFYHQIVNFVAFCHKCCNMLPFLGISVCACFVEHEEMYELLTIHNKQWININSLWAFSLCMWNALRLSSCSVQ